MGLFDSVKDILGMSDNEEAESRLREAGINLGNIFLPGGIHGGGINQSAQGSTGGGGFGGSPLNQQDWQALNSVWGNVRNAANFGDISPGHLPKELTPEARQFLSNNWSNIRRAGNLSDINWSSGIVGAPNYAQAAAPGAGTAPGVAPVAGGAPTSTLGDLEPARGMFAGLAASQAGQVGQNSQANILDLMRQQAQPYETDAFNRINSNLFSRGRLGAEDSATGEAYRGFSRGLAEADVGRQLSSFGLADQLQTSALDRSLGAAQGAAGLTNLSTLPFDMALRLAQARSGAALGQAQGLTQTQGQSLLGAWNQFWGGSGG